MIISAIAAYSKNRCIGRANDIPWDVPADMRYFMKTTTGHHVIMGRKNLEAMNNRPLPRRTNIVMSRQKGYKARGCVVVQSIEEAITLAEFNGENEVFIIGGGEIYKLALEHNLIDRLYLTELDLEITECSVYFPEFNLSEWKEVSRREGVIDEKNTVAQTYFVYEKLK